MDSEYPVTLLMTEAVLSVDVTSPVSEALRLLAEYPVNHLPVVRGRTLVGMLSSADVRKLKGFMPKDGRSGAEFLDQRLKIEGVMSQPVVSIRLDASAEDAARSMVTHHVHALPVVNEQQHLVGIVTTTDMMQALLQGPADPDRQTDRAAGASPARASDATPSGGDDQDLHTALAAAQAAVAGDNDPDGIARALLVLMQRVDTLEIAQERYRACVDAQQEAFATLVSALSGDAAGEAGEAPLADAPQQPLSAVRT